MLVFVFGGAGALARVGIAHLLPVRDLPWATLLVNVVGCLLIGVILELVSERGAVLPPAWRLPLAGGFLGGFTTFSAFGLETFSLLEQGRGGLALGYVAASVVLGVVAVAVGVVATRAVT